MKSLIGLRIARSYCEGYFSKDYDLEDAIVEAVGKDWAIVRLRNGEPRWQYMPWGKKEIKRCLREWSTPQPE
jgi:hypothetical protein